MELKLRLHVLSMESNKKRNEKKKHHKNLNIENDLLHPLKLFFTIQLHFVYKIFKNYAIKFPVSVFQLKQYEIRVRSVPTVLKRGSAKAKGDLFCYSGISSFCYRLEWGI